MRFCVDGGMRLRTGSGQGIQSGCMAELKQEFAFSLERLLGLGAWVRRPNSFSVLVPVPAKERKKTERLNRFFFFLLVPVRQSRAQALKILSVALAWAVLHRGGV